MKQYAKVVLLCLWCGMCLLARAAQPDLLDPEKAFAFSARALDPQTIEVSYRIAPGYYLYRERFVFAVAPDQTVKLGVPRLPEGIKKKDDYFGEVQTYRGDLRFSIPVTQSVAGPIELRVTSQGCADVGVCYVPQESKVTLHLAGATQSVAERPVNFGSEDSRVAALFQGSVVWLLASFFGFGLLLSLTPCVLPMIPILSGLIVGQGAKVTRASGLSLSLAYVLGMAVTYALAGVLAGLSGALLSAALQNAWVLGSFAGLFVVLSMSMFGFYELQLPASVQSRVNARVNRLPGGRFLGVFVMGALSALIVSPCIAAPLAGALLYISQSGDLVLGGVALFVLALGMGVPLLVVGASAGVLLPKAGPWMNGVKGFFGVLLLGVAIYLISPLLGAPVLMFLWGCLAVACGVMLGAMEPLPLPYGPGRCLAKVLGLVSLLTGVAYLVGALAGGHNIMSPLSGVVHLTTPQSAAQASQGKATEAHFFTRIKSVEELDLALQAAQGQVVLLDFYADWCVSCKEMERETFADLRVQQRWGSLVRLQADVTANNAQDKALLARFKLFGPPGMVFFDAQHVLRQDARVVGFEGPEKFLKTLDSVINN